METQNSYKSNEGFAKGLIFITIFFSLVFACGRIFSQDTIDLGNGFKKTVNEIGTSRLLSSTGFVEDSSGEDFSEREFLGTSKIITGFIKKSETIYLWAKDDYSRENHAFDIYVWDTPESPNLMTPYACIYDLPDSLAVTGLIKVGNEIIFSAKSEFNDYICTAEIVLVEPDRLRWMVIRIKK